MFLSCKLKNIHQ